MRLQLAGIVSCTALAAVASGAVPTPGQEKLPGAQIERGRSFEVASVRLTAPRTPPSRRVTNTRVDLTNISLRALLVRVFQIDQPSRLSAPDWLTEVNVDIHATIPEGSGREHVPEMLTTLLMTRFGLRAHVEPRPTDVYELVVGSSGVGMQEVSAVDEIDKEFPADPSRKPPQLDRTTEGIEGRMRSITTDRGQMIITGRSRYERIRTGRGTEEIDAARISMSQLATMLSFTVDRPVVDKTRLTGLYRLRIELPPPSFVIASVVSPITPINEPQVVSSFKAVEKLGLRLEPRRAMLDTLVVDTIERTPTDN